MILIWIISIIQVHAFFLRAIKNYTKVRQPDYRLKYVVSTDVCLIGIILHKL